MNQKRKYFFQLLITILLLFLSWVTSLSQSYVLVPLRIVDNAGMTAIDTFGYHCSGTRCIDGDLGDGLNEYELPPVPPRGILDARFVDPRGPSECMGQGLQLNLVRPDDIGRLDTFQIALQPSDTNYPISIFWNPDLVYSFISLRLVDFLGGIVINVDMLAETSITITNPAIGRLNIIAQSIFDFCPLSVPMERDNIPYSFALFQNYPNPFNPSTLIKYDIPEISSVHLVIYDMLGREVKTIVNSEQRVGTHYSQINFSELTGGVYYYRLTAGSFTSVKKMLLLK
jgi:hypothetical protein